MSALRHGFRLATVDAAISFRALFWWWNLRMFLAACVIAPLGELLFFVYVGRSVGAAGDAFFIIGNTVALSAGACLFGGMMAIANERQFGTLTVLLGSPAPRLPLFLGRALPFAATGAFVSAVSLSAGVVLLGFRPSGTTLAGLALATAAGAVSCSGLGLVMGAAGLRARDVWVLPNVLWMLLPLISGANIPPGRLPAWLDALGALLPLRHAIEAARAVADGATVRSVLPDLGVELGVGLAYAALAAAMLAAVERSAHRAGTLDHR